jgi:hypothetical protein
MPARLIGSDYGAAHRKRQHPESSFGPSPVNIRLQGSTGPLSLAFRATNFGSVFRYTEASDSWLSVLFAILPFVPGDVAFGLGFLTFGSIAPQKSH